MRANSMIKKPLKANFWFICILALFFCCISFVDASSEEYQSQIVAQAEYNQSDFTLTATGNTLNVTEIQEKSDYLVDTFITRYQKTLKRNGYARPTPLFNPDNQSLVGYGMTIQPDGVISTISIYSSGQAKDSITSATRDTKITTWLADEKKSILEKLNGELTSMPNQIGKAAEEREYRDWGTMHFVSDYYADLTSSDSMAYFYVKSEVTNVPGIYFHNQGKTGWDRLAKSNHYRYTHDWNWAWGGNPAVPNAVIKAHQPVNNPHNQEYDAELRWPPSAGITIHIKAPETGIIDGPVSLTKNLCDMNIRHATIDTDCNIGLTTNYGTEIETEKSSLTKGRTYSLAVVSMDVTDGFWDWFDGSTGPKSDTFQTVTYGNYAYKYQG